MKPTTGRIVHYGILRYVGENKELTPAAAIITFVHADSTRVNLAVFNLAGTDAMGQQAVPFSETLKEGSWTWPPRES